MTFSLGRVGEEIAVKLLLAQGFEIIKRNYLTFLGEIDVIAQRDDILHFIEVKTRTSLVYGTPASAVTFKKQDKIKKIAVYYMAIHRYSGDAQCDVIEVIYYSLIRRYKAHLITNAF